MRAWRLTSPAYAPTALSGDGAARYGGRWNPIGVRAVYLADSLALATLELAVHLTGANVAFVAIELDVPDELVTSLDAADLPVEWRGDEMITQAMGRDLLERTSAAALSVPATVVDERSNERNLVLDPNHPDAGQITEIQRFEITIDRRLTT